jgi:putative ABC transport system permease protein
LENPEDHQAHQIVMLGFDPRQNLWDFPDQKVNFRALTEPGTIIYDSKSREVYGPIVENFLASNGRLRIAASRHSADIVGLVDLGPGFANHGTVFVSDDTYNAFSVGVGSPLPSIGAIRLTPGADPDDVIRRLRATLPDDVRFVRFGEFLENEKAYWLKISPIGFVFTAGLMLGIIVGSVVVYQILYTDVTNHLAEYATMKAMGYENNKLFRLVILQALFMSVIGFIPGALMAKGIFVVTHNATQLPMEITLERLSEVYGMTFVMCVGSAMLAMQALRAADPAEIF